MFQPRKVQRSGLWQAVEGRVMILYPAADITLERIGDLACVELPALLGHRTAELPSNEAP